MGSWNGGSLSQRFLGRVKPGAPLKNRIEAAQGTLGSQIEKLAAIHEKLHKKHNAVFGRIVEAQRSGNTAHARAYAIELAQIRKMEGMVGGAKLGMEQVQMRLNTVSELGDIVVTLSPCMSVIKGITSSIEGVMPEAGSSMQDLSDILGDVLAGSSMGGHEIAPPVAGGADASAILDEAQSVMEGRAKESLPEAPEELKQDIIDRREVYT
ncbi:conserved protein implicated in secretion [Cenarchaeum symbiosum A]|uniref:Conserved protein implicated in secretion n=1 Tax=Cenarchaeum symbiosum (strain A) TaxID=414004 RepID=A0RWA1_CENSY|nr:conserved protein implicated in secretion [Cenarchaeum symbiosum A]